MTPAERAAQKLEKAREKLEAQRERAAAKLAREDRAALRKPGMSQRKRRAIVRLGPAPIVIKAPPAPSSEEGE